MDVGLRADLCASGKALETGCSGRVTSRAVCGLELRQRCRCSVQGAGTGGGVDRGY